MRVYTLVSGLIFLLLALTHGFRLVAEGTGPLANPMFVAATLISLVLGIWAMWTLRRQKC